MGEPRPISRRHVLLGSTIAAALISAPAARASLIVSNDRPYWRYCQKCMVLFYTESANQACAAGGSHQQQGLRFRLPLGGRETPTAQGRWYCCKNCAAMSFAGYPQRGRCPANAQYTTDRGHEADRTFSYLLPHDIAAPANAQPKWRYCTRCMAMFYNGYPTKGVCAAGGGHVAQGYRFVLPFET